MVHGPLRQDDDESLSAGRIRQARNASAKVRTDLAGLSASKILSHPSMQAERLSREPEVRKPSACSLGQDASSSTWSRSFVPFPKSIRMSDKDRVPEHRVFGEAHKGMPPNLAACLIERVSRRFGRVCQGVWSPSTTHDPRTLGSLWGAQGACRTMRRAEVIGA